MEAKAFLLTRRAKVCGNGTVRKVWTCPQEGSSRSRVAPGSRTPYVESDEVGKDARRAVGRPNGTSIAAKAV